MRMLSASSTAHVLMTLLCVTTARAASPHPCTRIQDDRERLACYDRTFGTPAEPKALPDPAPAKAEPTPEKFTAKVSKFEWRDGVFVATLDNDQVWLQTERDSRVQLEVGQAVTVRRGSLGSFFMSGDQGIAARVRRVK
jgi:hypothetical protein